MTAYCPTCRQHYRTKKNPPYAVMHVEEGGELVHLHPITREILFQLQEVGDEVPDQPA